MKTQRRDFTCELTQEFVERFVDGDLDVGATTALSAHAEACPECCARIESARDTKGALRRLPRLACPVSVIDAARRHIQGYERHDRGVRARMTRGALPALVRSRRWLLAGTVAAVCMAALWTFFSHGAPPSEGVIAPSANQIAQAEADIATAIACMKQVGKRTAIEISEEVIGPKVIAPVRGALTAALGETCNALLSPNQEQGSMQHVEDH